jgi:hypothetical protein
MPKLHFFSCKKSIVSRIHYIVVPLTTSLHFGLHIVRPTLHSVQNASKESLSNFRVSDDARPDAIINYRCLIPWTVNRFRITAPKFSTGARISALGKLQHI